MTEVVGSRFGEFWAKWMVIGSPCGPVDHSNGPGHVTTPTPSPSQGYRRKRRASGHEKGPAGHTQGRPATFGPEPNETRRPRFLPGTWTRAKPIPRRCTTRSGRPTSPRAGRPGSKSAQPRSGRPASYLAGRPSISPTRPILRGKGSSGTRGSTGGQARGGLWENLAGRPLHWPAGRFYPRSV
jgi:hypothetical protein